MSTKQEQIVERELIKFAHSMKDQGINTAEALALLMAGAAHSFGLTFKANEVPEKEAQAFLKTSLTEVEDQFNLGYFKDPGSGTFV